MRVNSKHLAEASVHGVFNSYLRENFAHILGEVEDMKSQQAMFKASTVDMVVVVRGLSVSVLVETQEPAGGHP